MTSGEIASGAPLNNSSNQRLNLNSDNAVVVAKSIQIETHLETSGATCRTLSCQSQRRCPQSWFNPFSRALRHELERRLGYLIETAGDLHCNRSQLPHVNVVREPRLFVTSASPLAFGTRATTRMRRQGKKDVRMMTSNIYEAGQLDTVSRRPTNHIGKY